MGYEPIIWFVALLWLGLSDPHANTNFSLCPLKNTGINDCPGCGLGRSVSYALHGEFSQSFHIHFLGIPTIIILTFRVCSLLSTKFFNPHSIHHKQKETIWPT
ncbi:MAG: DUF2752 domain-containing protein [Bacteroidota bacterium]|nr:DUF2752 domain-containing protein [Bacteroidota bacterium]